MKNNQNTIISPVYTLGVAATLSGVPEYSIRQYIDKGLIIPYKKESNRNLFSDVDILRLKFINRLLDEDGLNIAGIKSLLALIPCWSIRNCTLADRENCQAFTSTSFPCWEASEKGILCKNSDCRTCNVYCAVENYPDLKALIRTLTS